MDVSSVKATQWRATSLGGRDAHAPMPPPALVMGGRRYARLRLRPFCQSEAFFFDAAGSVAFFSNAAVS